MIRLLRTYFVIIAALIISFNAGQALAQDSTAPIQQYTDAIARKAVHFLNSHLPDSVYALAGEAFHQQATAAQWKKVFDTQIINLLPISNMTFKGREGAVNKYRLQGKYVLMLEVSLDYKGKIADFAFVPYKEEVVPLDMTENEVKTDDVALKVIDYLNARKPDSAYNLASDYYKSKRDRGTWRNFVEKQIYPLLPFGKPIFVGSTNGINKYKIDQLQFFLGLDETDKFSTFGIQPYREERKKTVKAATDNPMRSRLDSVVNRWLSDYIQTRGNVGLSAAVYYKGQKHYYNYGETAAGNHKLPDEHSIYEIGSLTKTFTATLLAKAVTDGLATLDSHIIQFLPDSVAANPYLRYITLKQLANHTSGLPRLPDNWEATITELSQPYKNYDDAHLFAYLKNYKAIRGAGITYEYSNLGAGLLGVILERIYHKPYPTLLREYISGPLQLNETKIALNAIDLKHLAKGYDLADLPAEPWVWQALQGAGSIKSSAFDMLQYGKLQLPLFNNPLSKYFSLTHQSTFEDGVYKVALGWHYLPKEKDVIIQHAGGTGGYRTAICVDITKNMVLVVLTNNATTGDTLGIQLMTDLAKEMK